MAETREKEGSLTRIASDEGSSPAVLITGGAQRIGRALALQMAHAGWNVAIHCHQSLKAAEELAGMIQDLGRQACVIQADLAGSPESVKDIVNRANNLLGPLTCLINNASRFMHDTLESVTPAQWDAHVNANLRAPVFLAQSFTEQLAADGDGHIINILDQRVANLTPHYLSYSASKVGLWAMTQMWALSLAPRVRVNAIGPGPTLANQEQDEALFERQWQKIPMRAPVDPDDIGRAVLFLLATPSITGQLITTDGGQHLAWTFPDGASAREED